MLYVLKAAQSGIRKLTGGDTGQFVGSALELIRDSCPEEVWNILRMLKALSCTNSFKCEKLEEAIGPNITDVDYLFCNTNTK